MRRTSFAVIPALAIGLGGLAAGASAFQESTPPAGGAASGPAHPFALHTGSCQQPSEEAAFTFDQVIGPQENEAGEPVRNADVRGRLTTPPLLQGSGTADVPLEELLDAENPYLLAVHESEAEFETLLACGEVAGPIINNQLTLALRPVGDAASAGIAALGANAEGGTDGTVILFAEVDAFTDGGVDRANNRTPRAAASGGTGGGGTSAGATRAAGGSATGGGGGGGSSATQAAGGGGAPAVTGGTSGSSTAPAVIGAGTDETPAATADVTAEATAEATATGPERTRTPGARRTAIAATEAAGGPTEPAAEPTATTEVAPEPTATTEVVPEPTATTEVVPEPTATTEVIAEPTATTEVIPEPTATTEVVVQPTTIVVEPTTEAPAATETVTTG